MRVTYRPRGEEFEHVETRFCCREAADCWESSTFSFETAVDTETDEPVPVVCVNALESTADGDFETLLPMTFCPFCGTGILCVEASEETET